MANYDHKSWGNGLRRRWGLLAQGSLFILGVVGAFVLPPPIGGTGHENKIWLRLAGFIVAILLGAMVLLSLRWGDRKSTSWWGIAAIVLLILSVAGFFIYQHMVDNYICQYFGRALVIGDEYTKQAQLHISQNHGITCSGLLEDFVGNAEDVWTSESINRCRMSLSGAYLACVTLFSLCIMTMVQALYSISRKGSGRVKN
jgi:hypothetical protein